MYNLNDTIAAFSSPRSPDCVYHIIRLSGSASFNIINSVALVPVELAHCRLSHAKLKIDSELSVDAAIYPFRGPHSYTGEDLIEVHLLAPAAIADALLNNIYGASARPAGPGEFTARAYFAGKLDLAQAQAVAQVISATNSIQLRAAQMLLKGALQAKLNVIEAGLLDLISLLEASLDFSEADIEFISAADLACRITDLNATVAGLLQNSLPARQVLSLPSVAIAGSSNAGKSSLFNALLARQRAIVSDQSATTRDVLTEVLKLDSIDIAIFDCAGLSPAPATIIDQMADLAARDAIAAADMVIFCVDLSKSEFASDVALLGSIAPQRLILCATKMDLPGASQKLPALSAAFNGKFLPISSTAATGLSDLKAQMVSALAGAGDTTASQLIALTQSQQLALASAGDHLAQALNAAKSDNQAVTSMLLRAAYRTLTDITNHQAIDDAVLDRIFSRFCIGK